MASLYVTPENQIQRLNGMLHQMKSWQQLDNANLISQPNPESWSLIEVVEHLNKAYTLYVDKVDTAIANCPDIQGPPKPFKARAWQKFVIEGQRPKNGKRPWKMKTLKRFQPLLDIKTLTKEDIKTIFERFFELHEHLKISILSARVKQVKAHKFSSAIGPIVNFYLPEGFEFLLCHMERHYVQIEGILAAASDN